MDTAGAIKLIISIVICQAAGLVGSIFTFPAIAGWYSTIQKPVFTPPNWVFAPVWTTLFLLMGISLYLVWNKGFENKKSKTAVSVFGLQLGLNVLWSFLFFGLQNPLLAFIEIILLWLAILATIILFYRISKSASYLLIPYLLWVSFATFLNYSIWVLNT
ncbi:MAG: tryptophan-rich sensory protein [Candidatus Diapherotrites archaeon]|nr:tryptophan-rich sensory protein [Candidatus Diapherotrites archaeon]